MHETNLTDTNFQKDVIDSRNEDQFLVPLFVVVCNQRYSILDIDMIKQIVPSQFKVAFGTSNSVISKPNNFPTRLSYNFNIENIFSIVDPITESQTDYFILIESLEDTNEEDELLKTLYEEINYWIKLLYDTITSRIEHSKEDNQDDELDYFE